MRAPRSGDRVRFRMENDVVEGVVNGTLGTRREGEREVRIGVLRVTTDAGDRYWVGGGDVLVIEDE